MRSSGTIFDCQIHPASLLDQDLVDLRFFGTRGVVALLGDDAPLGDAQEWLPWLEKQLVEGAARLRQAGIAPFFALGVPPSRIPERGFEEVLASFPRLSQLARVVAIGAIGFERDDEEEVEVFTRQLDVAAQLGLPVIVSTPARDKVRLTRRCITLLLAHGFPVERVLFAGVSAETLVLVRSYGFWASLLVHPSSLRPERAVGLVRAHGSQGIVLGSDLGNGPGNLVGIARTLHLLRQAGVSQEVARRVARENALSFFRVDPAVLDT